MDDFFTPNDFLEEFDLLKKRKKRVKTKRIKTQFSLASRLISLPRKALGAVFNRKIAFFALFTIASVFAACGTTSDLTQKKETKRHKIAPPNSVRMSIPTYLAKKAFVAPITAPAPRIKTQAKATLNTKGKRLIPHGTDTKEPIRANLEKIDSHKKGFDSLIRATSLNALSKKHQAKAKNFDKMAPYAQMSFLKEASFALSKSKVTGTTHDGVNLVILGVEIAKENDLLRKTTVGRMLARDMLDLIKLGKIKKIKKDTSLADKKIGEPKSKAPSKMVVANKPVPEAFKTVLSVDGFNALSTDRQKELQNANKAGPQTQIWTAKEASAELLKLGKKTASEDAARIIDWGIEIAKNNNLLDNKGSKQLLSDMAYMHATGKGSVGIDLTKAATFALLAGRDNPYTKKLIPYLQKIAPEALVKAEENFVSLTTLPEVRAKVAAIQKRINDLNKPARVASAKTAGTPK
ncbi:MAG TPA: hypothetical protein DD400_05155, partial [Rhodospirillaceae bacterium]|nr:hypothetical protein [Rhodospirillaceae bacterium]